MAYYALIAPKQQWLDANGNPLSGAKLFTYSAGTSTKKTTYTDDTGSVANANPIVLNSAGQCPNGVYGTSGAYKLVLAPSTDTDPPLSPIWTQDGVAGINDVAASTPDEWIPSGFTPTYISATSFSVAGDQTGTLQVGRRIKATLSGSTRYGFITSSSFGAGITTVVVRLDTGSLDATLSSVSYGLISVTNSSAPTFSGYTGASRELVSAGSVAAVTDLQFLNLSASFVAYELIIQDFLPATSATDVHIQLTTDNGATWKAGATDYKHIRTGSSVTGSPGASGSNADTKIVVANGMGNSAASGNELRGVFICHGPMATTDQTAFTYQVGYTPSGSNYTHYVGNGARTQSDATNGFRLIMSSGNITTCTYALYGLKVA